MILLITGLMTGLIGCGGNDPTEIDPPDVDPPGKDTTSLDDGPVDFSEFHDTYPQLASTAMVYSWAHYNTHDPSVINDDPFYYCYSTDVAYGHDIRLGLQIRRSLNLVEWEFVGWVFNGLPEMGADYIRQNGGEPNTGLWAPYIRKEGSEYRLYYSLASNVGRLSAIGMATADNPKGPFKEQGIVVTSKGDNSVHTNAIDPSVIEDQQGRQWLFYGSSWDGIYLMELDPETGLAVTAGDKGHRIAHRGFTNNTINGNIEGAEIIYNEEEMMYYLFISYDWLETKYNVRVGRSVTVEGPYLDYSGTDMNEYHDDGPMILAPYRFMGHGGWQGVAHPAVFQNDEGNYFIAHQGRPGVDHFYMVLHVRQLFWTNDGWPVVSSERFAAENETEVSEEELSGTWEQIVLGYRVVPGFGESQIQPDFQEATNLTIDPQGTVNGDSQSTWSYSAPWLTIDWNGQYTDQLRVERGRDWEKEVAETLLFTGLNQEGTAIWGKKIE